MGKRRGREDGRWRRRVGEEGQGMGEEETGEERRRGGEKERRRGGEKERWRGEEEERNRRGGEENLGG